MRSTTELLEYVPGALYLLSSHAPPPGAALDATPPLDSMAFIDIEKELPYQNFYLDFGPLHLAHLAAFARMVDAKIRAAVSSSSSSNGPNDDNQRDADPSSSAAAAPVCVYTSMVPQHRANAACLLGCWAMLVHKWSADRAFAPFQHLNLPPFHDASPNVDRFGLGVRHVLRGLELAIRCGFFPSQLENFDDVGFLEDMDPDMRDLTWVTPCIAAFAGPQSQQNWFGRTKPQDYVEYFRSRGVTTIVRLNSPKYDKLIFTRVGIDVVDLYFPDGTCPSKLIIAQFLALCTASPTAKIAVHCRAGLGRTGTLIACYLMAAFGFSAEEAVGWLRLCRPGSVIGAQQHFLRELQPRISEIVSTHGGKASGLEDPSLEPDDDDLHQQQHSVMPPTKGIATRRKDGAAWATRAPLSSVSSPSLPPRPSSTLLPPRVPGRRGMSTSATSAATAHATQGDLLLLRKHAQLLPLPLGASLWPQASSVGGGG